MKFAWRSLILAVLWIPLCGSQASQPDSLFHQSVVAIVARDFADPNISFLLLDARSGETIAVRWDDIETPIATGSLIKPFTAVAYGESHDSRFPKFHCAGGKTCWLPRGHGTLGITDAVAQSCNSYFHQLAGELTPLQTNRTFADFGLVPSTNGSLQPTLVGLDWRWKNSPAALLHAYLELAQRRQEKSVQPVLAGMVLSARSGTGRAVGSHLHYVSVLVKTGTTACVHQPHAPGDGLVVALVPAESPQLALLLRLHGAPGSHAAAVAGAMLAEVEEQTLHEK